MLSNPNNTDTATWASCNELMSSRSTMMGAEVEMAPRTPLHSVSRYSWDTRRTLRELLGEVREFCGVEYKGTPALYPTSQL